MSALIRAYFLNDSVPMYGSLLSLWRGPVLHKLRDSFQTGLICVCPRAAQDVLLGCYFSSVDQTGASPKENP